MVGVVGWLTSHDIRQHLQDLMLFLCSKVNHGHSLFGHRILSAFRAAKKSQTSRRGPAFSKNMCVFFAELGTRITHIHTSNNKKGEDEHKHQYRKLTRFCWNGIPTVKDFVQKTPRNFCDTLQPYLRSGLALYLDQCEREYQIPRSIE